MTLKRTENQCDVITVIGAVATNSAWHFTFYHTLQKLSI